jgi:thiol-disulfide isomerase/thioredoxin
MGMVKTVGGSRAKELLETKDGMLRIFFIGATWCEACQEMTVQMGIAAHELGRDAQVYKIDFHANEDLVTKYMKSDDDGVSIPYTLFRRKGKTLKYFEGYEDAEVIIEAVEEMD